MSTGYFLLDNPPARSQFRKTRRAKPTGAIVLHTAESILDKIDPDTGAENVAAFIRRRTDPGSYHRIADRDSIVKLVPFSYEAWQDATGSNAWAIGISLAMRAADWPTLSAKHRDELVDNMARMAHEAALWLRSEHGITVPARLLTKAQSDAGWAGFIYHGTRDPARRSDPGGGNGGGRHFPLLQFLNRFSQLQGGDPVATPDPLVGEIQQILIDMNIDIGAFGPKKDGRDNLLGPITVAGVRELADRNIACAAERGDLRTQRDALEAAVSDLERKLDDALADNDPGDLPADILHAADQWMKFTELVQAANEGGN